MKTLKYITAIALAVFLLTGLHQIRPEERAVVKRFGRIVAKPGPGLWVGLPWGIDRVERVPIATVRRVTVGWMPDQEDKSGTLAGQLLTGDENLVNVRIHIDYAIAEGDTSLEDYVLHRDRVDTLIAREAESALAEWVAASRVDDVLLTGSRVLPEWLVRRTQERIESHRLGVRIQQASVALLTAPDEVRSAFDAVNQAEANARTIEQRAHQEESQRLREAEATRYQLDQQGQAYADGKYFVAVAEAQSFLHRMEQYQRLRKQNPEILTAIWWDEMGKTLLGLKARGRIDMLDQYLGPDGLDVTQIVPPPKRR